MKFIHVVSYMSVVVLSAGRILGGDNNSGNTPKLTPREIQLKENNGLLGKMGLRENDGWVYPETKQALFSVFSGLATSFSVKLLPGDSGSAHISDFIAPAFIGFGGISGLVYSAAKGVEVARKNSQSVHDDKRASAVILIGFGAGFALVQLLRL